MNTVPLLSAQPWVERLGAVLLHFVWQGALAAGLYAAARNWTGRARPNVRYLLACAALAAMAAMPVVTWMALRPAPADGIAVAAPASPAPAPTAALHSPSASFSAAVYAAVPTPFLSWVVALWFAGAVVFWIRLAGGWMLAERLRSRLVRPAPAEWQVALDRLRHRIRVSRPVRLLISPLVDAPAVIGWLRPVVLTPVGALAGLPPEQMEALLLHELAHIRRHDYLINVLQSLAEALLFYHPAVWWISGHIRAERELCCDDAAIATSGDMVSYICALASLESRRCAPFQAAMAANGGFLAQRIARLVGQPRARSRAVPRPGTVAAAVLLAVAALAVFAQPADRPKFEVASVKPTANPGRRSVRPLPGRLTANSPVKLMIQQAYGVQAFQIAGGPDWLDSQDFTIEAKASGNADRAQVLLMLQSLLEDRFHLQFHRETREGPVYVLVAAKGGIKLSPPQEGGCLEPAPGALPPWAGGRIEPPGAGHPPAGPCGRTNVQMTADGARMAGGKVPMAEFVRSLSMVLARTVIDRTGFTGLFDFHLDFLPDEVTGALPPPPPDAAAALESRTPPITTALQQQLGLRLEATRGPIETIVIDHVERPAAN